jgi:hypothetical protein
MVEKTKAKHSALFQPVSSMKQRGDSSAKERLQNDKGRVCGEAETFNVRRALIFQFAI